MSKPMNGDLIGPGRNLEPTSRTAREAGRSTTQVLITASMLLLVAALWLATRPYYGVIHDARFYMVDAIRALHPARFADDLYFHFGSQDEFTIFTELYKPFVANFGVSSTALAFTIAGQLFWLGSLLYLARKFLKDQKLMLLSAAFAIALPGRYNLIFTYGEPFATPRLFAEALTMAALGLLLRRRTAWALVTLAAAAVMHPLMALPGLALALIYLATDRPLWWAAIAGGAIAALGLSVFHIPPFANLWVTFDPAWFNTVKVRDSFCLVTSWFPPDYYRTVGTAALALVALMLAEPRERRFLGSALAVGIGGVGVTLLGGDLARNVFVVEIQPWRSMWLLTLVANLYVVPSFIRLRGQGDALDFVRLAVAVPLGVLLLSRYLSATLVAAAPMMVAAALVVAWYVKTKQPLPLVARICVLLLLATGCAWTLMAANDWRNFLERWPGRFWGEAYSLALIVAALGTIAVQIAWAERWRLPGSGLSLCLAGTLFALALLGWDARSPWMRFVESAAPVPRSLATLLPQNASVYWEGDNGADLLWLRLHRASYFSCLQGAGALFFRATALEFQRRAESFWPLRPIDFGTALCPSLDKSKASERTRADLKGVCQREPRLDYLVLVRPVEGVHAKVWDSPVASQDESIVAGKLIVKPTRRFYVYSCAGLR